MNPILTAVSIAAACAVAAIWAQVLWHLGVITEDHAIIASAAFYLGHILAGLEAAGQTLRAREYRKSGREIGAQ